MRTEGQKQSQHHEKRLAKAVGGSRTAASGALDRKGDVRNSADAGDDFNCAAMTIEHKWTGLKSYTLKADVLRKIESEALATGRMPVFGLHLGGEDYIVLNENDFLDMRSELLRLREEQRARQIRPESGLGEAGQVLRR